MSKQTIVWIPTTLAKWKAQHTPHLSGKIKKFRRVHKELPDGDGILLKCSCGDLHYKKILIKDGYKGWRLKIHGNKHKR